MKQFFDVAEGGERLDVFLARVAPAYSRSFWQKQSTTGAVFVNGQLAKARQKLNAGDQVVVQLPEPADFSAHKLPIIYEDADVIVMDKPAGLLTHAKGRVLDEFSVGEFMRTRTTDGADTNRPGIVHRLDRGTSGVIIAAKHPAAKKWLQKQFAERKVKKTYTALVHGHPDPVTATLQLPIERNPRNPQSFRVGGNGKPAETTYETVRTFTAYTLVQLAPRTGRTHQLRVHMQYIGCPIVGDALYGTPEPSLGRIFLHAASLEITLPSRKRTTFTAPLPPQLQQFLDELA